MQYTALLFGFCIVVHEPYATCQAMVRDPQISTGLSHTFFTSVGKKLVFDSDPFLQGV